MNTNHWEKAYEQAPLSFIHAIDQSLQQKNKIKERKRRYSLCSLAATMVLIFLAGVGLAVANTMGAFDFLFTKEEKRGLLPHQTEMALQGRLEHLNVAVRDVVSDGISAHMAVVYTVKNPQTDAVILDMDYPKLYGIEGYREPAHIPMEQEGTGFALPYASKVYNMENVYIVGTTTAMLTPHIDLAENINWFYEDAGTLVVDYVLNLTAYGNTDEIKLNKEKALKEAGTSLHLTLTPTISRVEGKDTVKLEQGKLEVVVEVNKAPSTKYKATNLPIEIDAMNLLEAEFIVTPISTYAFLTCQLKDPTFHAALDIMTVEGKSLDYYPGMAYRYKELHEGDELFVIEQRYEPWDLRASITITPWNWVYDSEHQPTGERIFYEPFTIALEEMIDESTHDG